MKLSKRLYELTKKVKEDRIKTIVHVFNPPVKYPKIDYYPAIPFDIMKQFRDDLLTAAYAITGLQKDLWDCALQENPYKPTVEKAIFTRKIKE